MKVRGMALGVRISYLKDKWSFYKYVIEDGKKGPLAGTADGAESSI